MNVNLAALANATAYAAQQWSISDIHVEAVHGLDKWPSDIVVVRLNFAKPGDNDPFIGWLVATPSTAAYSSESQAVALGALVMGREVPGALYSSNGAKVAR
jgi:hypothetical protein